MSYSIQWRYAGGTWHDLSGGPWMNTTLNLTGFQPGTAYEWRVRSNCAGGFMSAWSNPAAFTTLIYSSCGMPLNLYTTNISNTYATFNWSPVSGAINYSVQIRQPGGSWSFIPGSPFTMNSASMDGLYPDTEYEWRVRSNCSNGQYSYWTSGVLFTTNGTSACDTPTGLYTYDITQTTATFDWEPVNGAYSYSVQWRFAGGTWYYLNGSPFTNTILHLIGFNPGTDYEWRIRSNCGNGMTSDWSAPVAFSTLGYQCQTPWNLSTSNVTDTTAVFSWAAVSGVLSYDVEIRVPNGSWYPVNGSPTTNTSIMATNLTPNTSYQWRVRANCGNGNYSYWSTSMNFYTGLIICNAPTGLVTLNITDTRATWKWDPVPGAISYSVEWRYPGGAWHTLYGGPWSQTSLNIIGFQPGTTYEWHVKSNCANGEMSDWSVVTSFTTISYSCQKPYTLWETNVTDNSAVLNWSPVSGAQSYTVEIRTLYGNWYTVPGSPFTGTSAMVSNLTPNTTYYWHVRTNCGNGQYSYWSNSGTFNTNGSGNCTAPTNLQTLDITQGTATFDWDPVAGAVSYSVQWRYAGGTWHNLSGGPWTQTLLHVAGFQAGTAYEWRVRSNCSNYTTSDWSAAAYFVTLNYAACDMPGGLNTTMITQTSATLNWSAVAGAQSYSVQYRLPYGTWYYVFGSPFMGTSVTVGGLNPNTTYEWRVRTNCSGGSSSYWTGPMSFTTLTGLVGDHDSDNSAVVYGEVNQSVEGTTLETIEEAPAGKDFDIPVPATLQLTPNPATDFVKIAYQPTDGCVVSAIAMTDYAGQRIYMKTYERPDPTTFADEIDVSSYAPGVYILSMSTSCGIVSEKIVVAR